MPKALADKTVIDLKPFANNARAKIAAALTEFQQVGNGVQVDATVNVVRLTGIEFDTRTLRVIAEANGTVKVAVTQCGREARLCGSTMPFRPFAKPREALPKFRSRPAQSRQ